MKKRTVEDLNYLYQEGEAVDTELFSEQRSNILLHAGEHYTRRGVRFWNRIRSYQKLTGDWKIRLTKNHIQRICKQLSNNILEYAPSVSCYPNNDKELSDKKAADLNNSVWQDIRRRHNFREKTRQWVEDLVILGECYVKIHFDPNKGDFLGYEQVMGDDGSPSFEYDAEGQMTPVPNKDKPVFAGDLQFERILGFNMLRAPEGKSFEDCPWVCYRKMVNTKEMKRILAGQKEKQDMINEDNDDTYMVFDTVTGQYTTAKGQSMLREFYFRPSAVYPNGYYYITTKHGILFEGELPYGIFPIVSQRWDEIQTTPRGRSVIKHLRPYQVEINRCASKIAEHQLTLGDDKLLIQSGSKLSQGGTLPGIRALNYTGIQPIILPGRGGEQYINTMESNIREMYEVANVIDPFSGASEKQPKGDAFTMLFSAMRDKRKFSVYAEKVEDFLVQVCETTLKLARNYYEADRIIPMIGKNEAVNMEEFKNVEDLRFQIRLEPQSDDIETKMGRHLVFNHILQYTGNNLEREDLGKLIRHMPYANVEGMFDDLTIDYDNATSDLLALDRGKPRPAAPNDNHEYIIKRLTHRMKEASYDFLSPMVKQLYEQKIQEHQMMLQQQLQDAQAAQAGFIPSGGYGVKLDFYITDEAGKTKRATLPYESVQWLIEKLQQQGSTQEMMENLPLDSQAAIGQAMGGGAQGGAGQGPGLQGPAPVLPIG